MTTHQVLINGQWRDFDSSGTFQANDPKAAAPIMKIIQLAASGLSSLKILVRFWVRWALVSVIPSYRG